MPIHTEDWYATSGCASVFQSSEKEKRNTPDSEATGYVPRKHLQRKVSWLLIPMSMQSAKRSGIHQGAIAAKEGLAPISFFALAPGSGLTAHPGINPG